MTSEKLRQLYNSYISNSGSKKSFNYFNNIIMLGQQKFGQFSDAEYDDNKNKFIFYDNNNDQIAEWICKDSDSIMRIHEKFNLNEDINEEKQISISFPVIVRYECDNDDISKDDIQNYNDYEKQCLQEYADSVVADLTQNIKYINDQLDTYDATFQYDGYDDNYNIYFILQTKAEKPSDELLIKTIKRYLDKDYTINIENNGNKFLFTAFPITSSNALFNIEEL